MCRTGFTFKSQRVRPALNAAVNVVGKRITFAVSITN